MSKYGTSQNHEGCTLQKLVAQLKERCEAVTRIQGGDTYYAEELQIFREVATENNLFISLAPAEMETPPSDEGNEHQVWYQPDTATFLKATWPDHFGMLVIHRLHEEPAASPIAYLERWLLHNTLFGDSVRFMGALDTDQGLRLIISQPAISGSTATEEQINDFFISSGWKKFTIGEEIAYFDPVKHIVISDTHRGNIIALDDGLLLPIDLRVQAIKGTLLDTVIKLTQ